MKKKSDLQSAAKQIKKTDSTFATWATVKCNNHIIYDKKTKTNKQKKITSVISTLEITAESTQSIYTTSDSSSRN